MERSQGTHDDLAVLEHMMAGGEMLAAQSRAASNWSREKRLAGAVLASALVEIRDHSGDRAHRRRVEEDLHWVESDDTAWPFSFVRLCHLFNLEPEWVRHVVRTWLEKPRGGQVGRPSSSYRHAA